jgi:3-oxoacyl-[acyl-carrier protein] reductase
LACDVTSEEQVRALVADTMGEFGRLDVFVNNAGVTRDASLKKMTVDQFDTGHHRPSARHLAGGA